MPWTAVWDLLLPPICLGCERLLRPEARRGLCTRCEPLCPPLVGEARDQGGITACHAYDGPLVRALQQLKYGAAAGWAGPLGRLLAGDPKLHAAGDGRPWDAIVAIPRQRDRRRRFGLDHARLLRRHALAHAGLPRRDVVELVRVRSGPAQVELDAAARRRNMIGAFAVARPASARGRRVLVLDDVTTTGATLQAARDALVAAGAAEVGALALLRTPA